MIRLGRGGIYRAEAEVVDALDIDGLELLKRLDRQADQGVLAETATRLDRVAIALTDVQAIGATGQRDLDAVIDDQRHLVLVQQRLEADGLGDHLLVAGMLVAQLHDTDAAAHGGHHGGFQAALGAQRGVGDQVKG